MPENVPSIDLRALPQVKIGLPGKLILRKRKDLREVLFS